MLGIHPIHRKMALIAYMSSNQKGEMVLDEVAIKLLKPLLLQNLQMIQRLDELNNLSFIAYEANEMEWLHDICARLESLKTDLFETERSTYDTN